VAAEGSLTVFLLGRWLSECAQIPEANVLRLSWIGPDDPSKSKQD